MLHLNEEANKEDAHMLVSVVFVFASGHGEV